MIAAPRFFRSLRGKLLITSVILQIAIVAPLMWNTQRNAEANLIEQFALRRADTARLLEIALLPAMLEHDYSSVRETLNETKKLQGISYLRIDNELGTPVESINLPDQFGTDNPEQDIFEKDVIDIHLPFMIAGKHVGDLYFGLDLQATHAARHRLWTQNLVLGISGILLTTLLFSALSLVLTRRLGALTEAAESFGERNEFQPIPSGPKDDLGLLVETFNDMAAHLQRRLSDLHAAESHQTQLIQTLNTERGRLEALLESIRMGLVFVTKDGRVSYANSAFWHLWQHKPTKKQTLSLEILKAQIQSSYSSSDTTQLFLHDNIQQEITLQDGRIITQFSVPVVIGPEATSNGQLWLFEDITNERLSAERLLFLAERDALTGLINRARFEEELHALFSRYARDPNLTAALLYFDIDEFKYINDSFGHRAGDTVLCKVANTISQYIRANEFFARLGGDEFVILVPHANEHSARTLADRIINGVSGISFEFDNRRLGITISMGIALLPTHANSAETLVSRADTAMYQAKHAGKNCWRVYRKDLDQSVEMLAQLGWNEKIQSAILENRLVLHFQGVHDSKTGAVSHYEALVRMIDHDDPDKLLYPGSFIPAAERTGRIVDIDRWVIHAAIEKLARHPKLSALAINVSARSFDDPDLANQISQKLADYQVTPKRLIVELTETSALSNMRDSERFIQDLRHLGCTVCLDDFGVGFSSFAYLKHLSADVLKIDGMFIRNLCQSREDQVFVRAIVEVARGLGKHTVAEFVGDAQTLTLLHEIGVDYAQGYYLSKPEAQISID